MPHDKPRLYVALYARSKPNEYHWALIVDPKKTDARTKTAGIRYHATNSPDSTCQRQNGQGFDWRFERRPLGEGVVAAMLLARIAVGKVKDLAQLEQTLAKVTVRQDSTFTCRTWLIDAVRYHSTPNTTKNLALYFFKCLSGPPAALSQMVNIKR